MCSSSNMWTHMRQRVKIDGKRFWAQDTDECENIWYQQNTTRAKLVQHL